MVGFFNTERPEIMKQFYSQLAKMSSLNSSDEVNQHVVVCGGDGSLSYLISELAQYQAD